MLRINSMAALFAVLVAGAPATAVAEPEMMSVYKSPWCGCCAGWVDHMRAAGFQVEVTEMEDLQGIKALAGVPAEAMSCHTAMIDAYAVEGHVPADIITRLLEERPAVSGIAVPGMPIGSPGMEGPNPQAYSVKTFTEGEVAGTFATVTPN